MDAAKVDDKTGAVRKDMVARGLDAGIDKRIERIAGDPVLSKETGATFDLPDPRGGAPKLRSFGGGKFFGRTLGVLSIVGDLQFIWEAGQVLSGRPPREDSLACSLAAFACPPPVA